MDNGWTGDGQRLDSQWTTSGQKCERVRPREGETVRGKQFKLNQVGAQHFEPLPDSI